MKRLTWHNGEYWTQVQDTGVGYKDICARLAAYEDTGLEPEVVKDMAENVETRLLAWFEAKYGMSIGRMMDLIEAEQAGRLTVLPFCVGSCVNGKDNRWSGTVEEIAFNRDGYTLYVRSGGGGFYVQPNEVTAAAGMEDDSAPGGGNHG